MSLVWPLEGCSIYNVGLFWYGAFIPFLLSLSVLCKPFLLSIKNIYHLKYIIDIAILTWNVLISHFVLLHVVNSLNYKDLTCLLKMHNLLVVRPELFSEEWKSGTHPQFHQGYLPHWLQSTPLSFRGKQFFWPPQCAWESSQMACCIMCCPVLALFLLIKLTPFQYFLSCFFLSPQSSYYNFVVFVFCSCDGVQCSLITNQASLDPVKKFGRNSEGKENCILLLISSGFEGG